MKLLPPKISLILTAALFAVGCATIRAPASYTVDEGVIYRSLGRERLKMDIYAPANGRGAPFPMIVHVHGGAWVRGGRSSGSAKVDIPLLASQGFLVASIDYRLAPSWKFPAPLDDLDAAIAFLRKNAQRLGADPGRIGLLGTSAGAHIASLYALRGGGGGAVRAVVDMFGPADLPVLFARAHGILAQSVFGARSPMAPVLREYSPVAYACAGAPPFLVIHGENDSLVPIAQSEELAAALLREGAPVDFIRVVDAAHALRPSGGQPWPSRKQISRRIGDFFEQHLR